MIDWKCKGRVRIAAIGECMIERRAAARGVSEKVAGAFSGDTLNTLTYLARALRREQPTLFYITALGVDADSDAMLAAWQAEGINTALVRRLRDRLPGSYTIITAADGERRFSYDRAQAAAREVFRDAYAPGLLNALKDLKLFYLSGISVAILARAYREELLQLLQSLRQAGVIIVYDPNYRALLWSSPAEARDWAERVYRETDVALPGFADERTLFDDVTPEQACARLTGLGVTEVIMKNGAAFCMVATGGDTARFPVTAQNHVVDTTAAGDSFNAGYISARLCGNDVASSVRAGQFLSALVTRYPGAIMPRALTPALAEMLA